jgi:hypothetical protein
MSATIIQYRTHPHAAAENRRLVEAVVKDATEVGGIRYTAYQQADGVTFVHIAGANGEKLQDLSSFAAFQRDLESRVEPGSRTVTKVDTIGLAAQDRPSVSTEAH